MIETFMRAEAHRERDGEKRGGERQWDSLKVVVTAARVSDGGQGMTRNWYSCPGARRWWWRMTILCFKLGAWRRKDGEAWDQTFVLKAMSGGRVYMYARVKKMCTGVCFVGVCSSRG